MLPEQNNSEENQSSEVIRIKEEAIDGAELGYSYGYTISHPAVGSLPNQAGNDDEDESQPADIHEETIEIARTPQDVVFSLCDERYKLILEKDIRELADMRSKGVAHDQKERAELIMQGFREETLQSNGRYLQLDLSSKTYFVIDEKKAKEKIYRDLSRESGKMCDNRRSSAEKAASNKKSRPSQSAKSDNTKKHKPNDSLGARPKRGVQQLKENKNMPYMEKIHVASIELGYHVFGYNDNVFFKPKHIIDHKDKLECAGQAFAKQLITQPEWNVKVCHLEDDTSAFVIYKDCNNCNLNERNAEEGKTKFTGYRQLAGYVFSKGMEKMLIQKEEVKKVFDDLGLSCSDEERTTNRAPEGAAAAVTTTAAAAAAAVPQQHQATILTPPKRASLQYSTNEESARNHAHVPPSETANRHASISPIAVNQSSTSQQTSTAPNPSVEVTAQPNTDDVIKKRNELKVVKTKVQGELARYRTTYISNEDSWKRDTGVYFYRMLSNWLVRQAGDKMSIRKFDGNELTTVITEFESTMADLMSAEESNEDDDAKFHMNMIESWVAEIKDKYPVA